MPLLLNGVGLFLAVCGGLTGGPSTKASGVLTLLGIAFISAGFGWRLYGRMKGGEDK